MSSTTTTPFLSVPAGPFSLDINGGFGDLVVVTNDALYIQVRFFFFFFFFFFYFFFFFFLVLFCCTPVSSISQFAIHHTCFTIHTYRVKQTLALQQQQRVPRQRQTPRHATEGGEEEEEEEEEEPRE
jgi:hypothetical protein